LQVPLELQQVSDVAKPQGRDVLEESDAFLGWPLIEHSKTIENSPFVLPE